MYNQAIYGDEMGACCAREFVAFDIPEPRIFHICELIGEASNMMMRHTRERGLGNSMN